MYNIYIQINIYIFYIIKNISIKKAQNCLITILHNQLHNKQG